MKEYSDLLEILKNEGVFTDREIGLIENMVLYASNSPHGLPGHNIMLIAAKLVHVLNNMKEKSLTLQKEATRKVMADYISAYLEVHGEESAAVFTTLINDYSTDVSNLYASKLETGLFK